MVKQFQIRKPWLFVDFGPNRFKYFEVNVIAFVKSVRFSFGFDIWRREYSR